MSIAEAASARQRGNELFRAGLFEEAASAYGDAVNVAAPADKSLASISKDERAEAISAILNRAQCWLKLKRHNDAAKDCTRVLEGEPANEKALFRRATAYEVRLIHAALHFAT